MAIGELADAKHPSRQELVKEWTTYLGMLGLGLVILCSSLSMGSSIHQPCVGVYRTDIGGQDYTQGIGFDGDCPAEITFDAGYVVDGKYHEGPITWRQLQE